MSAPQEQPQPEVTAAPAVNTASPRSRRRLRAVPTHLGRARTSTVVLAVLFAAVFVLYLFVRPESAATSTTGGGGGAPAPAATSGPSATSARPSPTAPTTTTTTAPPAETTTGRSTTPGGTTRSSTSTTTGPSVPTAGVPPATAPAPTS